MSLFDGPATETEIAPSASGAVLTPPASGPDRIPALCAEIGALCDILRGERAYLGLCSIYPSSAPGADARVREGQLRVQNVVFLLREARREIVLELESLIA